MKTLLFLLFSAVLFAKPAPKETIKKFQDSWDKTKKYSAQFKQTVTSKSLGTKEESEGTLFVVKPGKLRWNSNTDMSSQILNGSTFTSIRFNQRKKNRTVDIYKDISKMVDMRALGFLAGDAKFGEVYMIEQTGQTSEIIKLKLIPKEKKGEYYIAEIQKKSYVLTGLTTETPDSTVQMSFSGVEINPVIEDKVFEYEASPNDIVNKQ